MPFYFRKLTEHYSTMPSVLDLSVELAPNNSRALRLRNPVMTASGTFGYGMEFAELTDIQNLGAIICKGTTLKPRKGNPQTRIVETASGMLNSIGLQNIGVEALIREKAPVWATWQVPVIVNVAGETVEEYYEIARALEGVQGVSGIEVNISCPNVTAGGLEFGTSPEMSAKVTEAVKDVYSLPVIVKLTPNVTDIVEIAQAVVEAGADALSLVNTFVGMSIDANRRRPLLGTVTGGLSGPAIKPLALAKVYKVSRAVDIPVIGIGGIFNATDALEFIMAGARAVQVGTANFVNPNAAIETIEGIEAFCIREGIRSISELVGAAWQSLKTST
ncbi:MAG: dihydroorotate dehydrogenase [Chloroflexi bacterium]|nr:dihydroorotate dehydrogenase [Chloroflexota bacterium]